MKDMGVIQGSATQAVPIVIGKDMVYIHSDITQIEDGLFEYHEIQYGKDEYIATMAENSVNLAAQASNLNLELEELTNTVVMMSML